MKESEVWDAVTVTVVKLRYVHCEISSMKHQAKSPNDFLLRGNKTLQSTLLPLLENGPQPVIAWGRVNNWFSSENTQRASLMAWKFIFCPCYPTVHMQSNKQLLVFFKRIGQEYLTQRFIFFTQIVVEYSHFLCENSIKLFTLIIFKTFVNQTLITFILWFLSWWE